MQTQFIIFMLNRGSSRITFVFHRFIKDHQNVCLLDKFWKAVPQYGRYNLENEQWQYLLNSVRRNKSSSTDSSSDVLYPFKLIPTLVTALNSRNAIHFNGTGILLYTSKSLILFYWWMEMLWMARNITVAGLDQKGDGRSFCKPETELA